MFAVGRINWNIRLPFKIANLNDQVSSFVDQINDTLIHGINGRLQLLQRGILVGDNLFLIAVIFVINWKATKHIEVFAVGTNFT